MLNLVSLWLLLGSWEGLRTWLLSPVAQVQHPTHRFPSEFGFTFSIPHPPRLMLPSISVISLCYCPKGCFFLKTMSKVMTGHCSAPRLQSWLIFHFPQETRRSRMRWECWVLFRMWNEWFGAHFWITDTKIGYIPPSVAAGQLWGNRILFYQG